MKAMVERQAVAQVIARLLALSPSDPSALPAAMDQGVPGFLTREPVWEWAAHAFPGDTWLDIGKKLRDGGVGSEHTSGLISTFLGDMFPQYSTAIPAIVGAMQADPVGFKAELGSFLTSHETITKVVNKVIAKREEIIRCGLCHEPYVSDGTTVCPSCNHEGAHKA